MDPGDDGVEGPDGFTDGPDGFSDRMGDGFGAGDANAGFDPVGQGAGLQPSWMGTSQPRFWRAVAAGLFASVLLGWVWGEVVARSGFQIGWLALGLGWGVAAAVVHGAKSTAPAYQALAVGVTTLSLALGEYFTIRSLVIREFDFSDVPFLTNPADMLLVARDSVQTDPVTLAFWALGAFGAWRMVQGARDNGLYLPAPIDQI